MHNKKTWLLGFLRADENITPIKTRQTCRLTLFFFNLTVFKSTDFVMHLSMSLCTTQINQSALKVVGVPLFLGKTLRDSETVLANTTQGVPSDHGCVQTQ